MGVGFPHAQAPPVGPGRSDAPAVFHSHPALATVPRRRVDVTPTGIVIEFEESWEDEQGRWYCRELTRAEVRDGSLGGVSIHRTGNWDPATRTAHAHEVTLLRP